MGLLDFHTTLKILSAVDLKTPAFWFLANVKPMQGDQMIRKNSPNFSENSPKSYQVKKGQNSYYFNHSKNHNEPPKVAQLAKNRPIWSP